MSDPTSIQQDIQLADAIITPWVSTFNPVIGAALALALKLAAVAEPAVYKAVAAAISGQELTTDQLSELTAVETKLKSAGQYFANPPTVVTPPVPVPGVASQPIPTPSSTNIWKVS